MRTPEGKVVLWDAASGVQSAFWPIDAKALLKGGSHVAEPPAQASVAEPEALPTHVTVPPPAVPVLPPSVATAPRRRRSSAEG